MLEKNRRNNRINFGKYELSNVLNLALWSFKTLKSWNLGILELGNLGSLGAWNLRTLKLRNVGNFENLESNNSLINQVLLVNGSWFMAHG